MAEEGLDDMEMGERNTMRNLSYEQLQDDYGILMAEYDQVGDGNNLTDVPGVLLSEFDNHELVDVISDMRRELERRRVERGVAETSFIYDEYGKTVTIRRSTGGDSKVETTKFVSTFAQDSDNF